MWLHKEEEEDDDDGGGKGESWYNDYWKQWRRHITLEHTTKEQLPFSGSREAEGKWEGGWNEGGGRNG